jgi:SAM-dependent methyltransferase
MSIIRSVVSKVRPLARTMYRRYVLPPPPNLIGDRDVEYSWISANMPEGPGRALDFGAGKGNMGLIAAFRGFDTTAIDLLPLERPYVHRGLSLVQGDVLKSSYEVESFDLIINCSVIEHVGLVGRYEIDVERRDGDLIAMKRLLDLLRPGGRMLLTIPVGVDTVFFPLHRIYGEQRLPLLLDGWRIVRSEFWTKDDSNRWISVERSTATGRTALAHCFSLGLFVLEK